MAPSLFEDVKWQMPAGERAALEGLLATSRPRLAIQVGNPGEACLELVAAHAGEVHAFRIGTSAVAPDNVVVHAGETPGALRGMLDSCAAERRNVDMVFLDGQPRTQDIGAMIAELLDSPALSRSLVVVHGTGDPRLHRDLEAARLAAWPKVTRVELDLVPGRLAGRAPGPVQAAHGLGVVLIDASAPAYFADPPYVREDRSSAEALREAAELTAARDLVPAAAEPADDLARLRVRVLESERAVGAAHLREAELRERIEGLEARAAEAEHAREQVDRILTDVTGSASWRVTRPLRAAKRGVNRRD